MSDGQIRLRMANMKRQYRALKTQPTWIGRSIVGREELMEDTRAIVYLMKACLDKEWSQSELSELSDEERGVKKGSGGKATRALLGREAW